MKMYGLCWILLLAAVICNRAVSHSGPRLSDVNILLPPKMTHAVEYTLHATGGCFEWSWDDHDILSVVPEYNDNPSNDCSTSAHLMSIAPFSGRKETAVYATHVDTGRVLSCKVYIDDIATIRIFHTNIKIDIDELATFRVGAFDSQENVFSSLVGIRFMWQLIPETHGSTHHLVHVPIKLSPLSDCGGLCGHLDVQIKLEDAGQFSDLYVVKGTEIGHERVSVNLFEPTYDHMADTIILTVAETMIVNPPSPIFVLVGAVVQYVPTIVRGNTPQAVTLPSPYHQWSVLNSTVSRVDTQLGRAHALNLGVTTVTVEDVRVAGHIHLSFLHVVLPNSMCLYILPLSHSSNILKGAAPIPSVSVWYVVANRQYLLEIKVFSLGSEAQEIYITESDDIKLHNDHFEFGNTSPVSDNTTLTHGWSKFLRATSDGLKKLTATLTYSNGVHEVKEVLKIVHDVMICEQVKLGWDKRSSPGSILLPWTPAVYQEVELKATGGCAISSSDYKWHSTDMSTVCVSENGIVQSKKPGKVIITVVSNFDDSNYDEVEIEVSVPSSMIMMQHFPVEAVVGSSLAASLTLKASNGDHYFRCDAFSSAIQWNTGSDSFKIVHTDRVLLDVQEVPEIYASFYGPPCASTRLYASGIGRTMLYASLKEEFYHIDHSLSVYVDLKASALISAYPPLFLHQAADGNHVGGYAESHRQLENLKFLNLVPGTHMDVILSGGPEKWERSVKITEFVEILPVEHTNCKGVSVRNISTVYGSSYRISCENCGKSKLLFKRGNLAFNGNILPSVAVAELFLTCSLPSSILLIIDSTVNTPDVIQTAMQADQDLRHVRGLPITVANGRTIKVSAVGISDSGKAFENSSFLSLKWEVRNCSGLCYWDDDTTSLSNWERFLVLQNSTGLCVVHATVVGFIDTSRNHHTTKSYESSKVLEDAVQLKLVLPLKISPEFQLLYFSPMSRLNLSISGGSCTLDTVVNDTLIVELIENSPDLQCLQLLLVPKSLGIALIKVCDTGVVPLLAATSVVQVAEVDWLKITSGELISLVEGSTQSVHLLAGINDGRKFDFSQYMYMNIFVHIEDHVIKVIDGIIGGYVRAPNFIIKAKNCGITILYLSAKQQSGRVILSQFIEVEVYAPFSIRPSNIYLVPGASYVLTVEGGPTMGCYVEYGSMNDETAIIHKSSGRLNAIAPGNSTVVATMYENGGKMVCQAYGNVVVAVPSSLILNVQSEQVAVGHNLPIYPWVANGDIYSSYELCKNYGWIVKDGEVMTSKVENSLHRYKYGSSFPLFEENGSNVSVYAPAGILTNAPFSAEGYSFLVTFSDALDQSHEALLYDCKVEPSYVGYAKPWRDFDIGKSYCIFFPYSPEHLERSVGNSKGTRHDISVSVSACVRGAINVCGSASSLFIGGFAILKMHHDSLQLDLTRKHNKSVITVVGNTGINVYWKARKDLLITPIHRRNYGVAGRAEYEVKVLSLDRFKDKVILSLAANGQRVEIDVNFKPGKAMPPPLTMYDKMTILLYFSAIMLIVHIADMIMVRRSRATQSVAVQQNEYSQQFPQAFIDYVKRTVNETPFQRKFP